MSDCQVLHEAKEFPKNPSVSRTETPSPALVNHWRHSDKKQLSVNGRLLPRILLRLLRKSAELLTL